MNKRILLLVAVVVGLSSCSTLYKSGQTPDDLYYSPAPQQRVAYSGNDDNDYYDDNSRSGDEYVNVQTEQDRSAYSGEDNYLRMKVRNRALWSSLDDYGYYGGGMMYSPYLYGSRFGMGFGYNPYSFYSPYSSYFGMSMGYGWGGLYNGFYNPYSFYSPYSFYDPYSPYGYGYYYPGLISVKPGNVRPAGTYSPRTSNLRGYGNRNSNPELNNGRNAPVRVFRNGNNNYVNPRNSSSGNTSPRRSIDRSSDSRPSRTFERSNSAPSSPRVAPSSNSGSRSSGGGGSAPSRAPGRGGR